jgi:FkbM family methyltransferase
MKVFLDVGAHTGQTLLAAQRWNFDRIVSFEPASVNLKHLRELVDSRTTIEPFGLWDRTGQQDLHDIGSQGASIWERPNRARTKECCSFVRATDWFRDNLHASDTVWLKVNTEGAELDILTDLLDSGEFDKVSFAVVMWDARKIPQLAPRMQKVKARIEAKYPPPRVVDSNDMRGAATHTGRVDTWLTLTGAVQRR